MINEKTDKYVVVKLHTLNHSVGDVIELTDSKAASLSGKVRLQSEGVENVTVAGASQRLKDINTELSARIEKLEDASDDLIKENLTLSSEVKSLKAKLKAAAKK